MPKLSIDLSDMTPAQLEREKGLVLRQKSSHTLDEIQKVIDTRSLHVSALISAEKITAEEEAAAEAAREAQHFLDEAQAAFDAAKALDAATSEETDAIELLGKARKKRMAVGAEVIAHVEAALGVAAQGDRSFVMTDLALLQQLVAVGVPVRSVGLGPTTEIAAAASQAISGFLGQLRIEARKRGVPVPK